MYEKSKIRTSVERVGDFGWQVDATHQGEVLYRSEIRLAITDTKGYKADLDAALRNAQCLWCGDPANFVTEIDGLDIFGFCSSECHAEALREAHDADLVR